MNINKLIRTATALWVPALLLAGCAHDKIYDTPYPDKGTVSIKLDWSGIGAGIQAPSGNTVVIGTQKAVHTGTEYVFDALFDPGVYDVFIYNTPSGINVSGTTASVAPSTRASHIEAYPEWFFSWAGSVDIKKDSQSRITAKMGQHIRLITLKIDVDAESASIISSLTATLDHVAGQFNMRTGKVEGPQCTASSPFTLNNERTAYMANFRIFGFIMPAPGGEDVNLTLDIVYKDGNNESIPLDITEYAEDFGSDMTEPLKLDSNIKINSVGGFTASVSPWIADISGEIDI